MSEQKDRLLTDKKILTILSSYKTECWDRFCGVAKAQDTETINIIIAEVVRLPETISTRAEGFEECRQAVLALLR